MPVMTLEVREGMVIEGSKVGKALDIINDRYHSGSIKRPRIYRLGPGEVKNATPRGIDGANIQWIVSADKMGYNGIVSITGDDKELCALGFTKKERRIEIDSSDQTVFVGENLEHNGLIRLYTIVYWEPL